MDDLDSEFNLDMTEVWSPVLPATREAPAAEPGVGAGGRAEGNPPIPSVSPGRADFGGINGSSNSSSSSDISRTTSDSSNRNDSGDLTALALNPARDLMIFSELPALQSGRTKSQSRGLTMSTPCPDAILAYICHEGRVSQEDRRGGDHGNRTSSRSTAGSAPGKGA